MEQRKYGGKISKALMTILLSFELPNIGWGYYFVVGAWLSNFRQGFNNSLGTFILIMGALQKMGNLR